MKTSVQIALLISSMVWAAAQQGNDEKIVRSYPSIASLLVQNPNIVDNCVSAEGLNASGDGGGGMMRYYPTSTAATNTSTVFAPIGFDGRWIMVFGGPGTIGTNAPVLFSGIVSNSVASDGLLSVDATKTNGIAATAAHITNAWGIFTGDSTKAVGGNAALVQLPNPYTGEPVLTVSTNYTLTYTNNSQILIVNSATNLVFTFADGATNGFNVTIKNLGAGTITITNAALKTFDGFVFGLLPTGTITHWIADGTNYRGGRISPNNYVAAGTFYSGPVSGTNNLPTMRSMASNDLPASVSFSTVSAATLTISGLSDSKLIGTDASTNVVIGDLPKWTNTAGIFTGDSTKAVGGNGALIDPYTGAIVTATKAFQSYQGSLTHAGTMTLDFNGTTTVNAITLTGNVTFATSNLATNRTYRLKITGTSTNATPTFPAWNFLGGAPSTITASKVGMLSLEAWGTTDSSVVAAYAEAQ